MTVGDAVVTAVRVVGVHWRTWLRTAVMLQVLAGLVAGPVIVLLLRAALATAGVPALTEASIGQLVRHPPAVLLLMLLAGVATTAALVQHAAFVLLGRAIFEGRIPRIRELAADGLAVARGLVGPHLGLVALYVFVLVPLGGLQLGASLARGIELPPFIAGELQKTPLGTSVWLVGYAAVLLVNLRLAFVPVLLTTGTPPAAAFSASWRLSRRRVAGLAALAAALWLGAAVVTGGLMLVTVGLARVMDAVWPSAAPVVAVSALAAAQALLVVGGGLLAGFVSVVLLALSGAIAGPGPAPTAPAGRRLAAGALALLLAGGAVNATALLAAGSGRTTAVVAHRGDTYGAVENTLESLEAAATLGADVVELDVLQAADGGLVVVHDTNLRRIAGVNREVAAMTTAELTATTVRQGDHVGTIPTFEAFAARAAELGVPLLVELKSHGREHGDLVGDVVAVLEQHDLVEGSLVQAFDRETVTEIESRFPEVTTGWVVAFSRGRLDPGVADFVTMEQTSYSPAVLRQAHAAGVAVYLWTVTDPVRMRVFIRDGVDGLITGDPRSALHERSAVDGEAGVADRLADTLRALADW